MPIIDQYNQDSNLELFDKLLGTSQGNTRSYSLQSIGEFFASRGIADPSKEAIVWQRTITQTFPLNRDFAIIQGTNIRFSEISNITVSNRAANLRSANILLGLFEGLVVKINATRSSNPSYGLYRLLSVNEADQEGYTDLTLEYIDGHDDDLLVPDDTVALSLVGSDPEETITDEEIKEAYERNPDTNAFTNAEQSKLLGIEDNATADQTGAEIKVLYEAEDDTNAFTDTDVSKLSGIEDNATADQTASEIKTAYESNSNTNALTDLLLTKINGIDDGATDDQTAAEIVALVNASISIIDADNVADFPTSKITGLTAAIQDAIAARGDVVIYADMAAFTADTTTVWHHLDVAVVGDTVYLYVGTENATSPSLANDFRQFTNPATAMEILTQLLTVDGTGSGLDADLLDGQHASEFAPEFNSRDVSREAVVVVDQITVPLAFDSTLAIDVNGVGTLGGTTPQDVYDQIVTDLALIPTDDDLDGVFVTYDDVEERRTSNGFTAYRVRSVIDRAAGTIQLENFDEGDYTSGAQTATNFLVFLGEYDFRTTIDTNYITLGGDAVVDGTLTTDGGISINGGLSITDSNGTKTITSTTSFGELNQTIETTAPITGSPGVGTTGDIVIGFDDSDIIDAYINADGNIVVVLPDTQVRNGVTTAADSENATINLGVNNLESFIQVGSVIQYPTISEVGYEVTSITRAPQEAVPDLFTVDSVAPATTVGTEFRVFRNGTRQEIGSGGNVDGNGITSGTYTATGGSVTLPKAVGDDVIITGLGTSAGLTLVAEDTDTSTVTVDGNLIIEDNLYISDISANDDEQQLDVSEDVADYAMSITIGDVGTSSIIDLSTDEGRAIQNALNSTGGTNLKLYIAAQNDDINQNEVVTAAIEGPFLTVFSITEGADAARSSITFEETVEDDDPVFGTGNLITYTWFLAELRSENSILVRSNVIFEGDVSGIINRPERYSYASEDTLDWDELPSSITDGDATAAYDDPFHTARVSYRGHIVLINKITFADVDITDSATSHTVFSLPEATVARLLEADPNTIDGLKRIGLHGVDEPGRAVGAVTPNQFVNRATSNGGLLYDPDNVAGPGGSNATVDADGNTQVRIKIFYRVRDNANEVIPINATSDFDADFLDQGNRAQLAEMTDVFRSDSVVLNQSDPDFIPITNAEGNLVDSEIRFRPEQAGVPETTYDGLEQFPSATTGNLSAIGLQTLGDAQGLLDYSQIAGSTRTGLTLTVTTDGAAVEYTGSTSNFTISRVFVFTPDSGTIAISATATTITYSLTVPETDSISSLTTVEGDLTISGEVNVKGDLIQSGLGVSLTTSAAAALYSAIDGRGTFVSILDTPVSTGGTSVRVDFEGEEYVIDVNADATRANLYLASDTTTSLFEHITQNTA